MTSTCSSLPVFVCTAAVLACGLAAPPQANQRDAQAAVPKWAQAYFFDTGVDSPKHDGGPIFRRVETIGQWETESTTLRGVWVARVIPDMPAPRGLSDVLLVDDATDEVMLRWRHATGSDVRFDVQCNALRVFGIPVEMTDDSIGSLRQNPDLTIRSNADEVASEAVKSILTVYLSDGLLSVARGTLNDVLKRANYVYWDQDVPAERIVRPELEKKTSQILPNQPATVRLLETFAHEIGIATGMRHSKAWEAVVLADVVNELGDVVRLEFLVYGDHAVDDLVSRTQLVAMYASAEDRSDRSIKWELHR